ncbi:hypothetical protein Hanom_Chr10g00946411 [Helianthus anomalus]
MLKYDHFIDTIQFHLFTSLCSKLALHVLCLASISDIAAYYIWYYMCSKCPEMVYPENNHFVCADHDIIPYPKYM